MSLVLNNRAMMYSQFENAVGTCVNSLSTLLVVIPCSISIGTKFFRSCETQLKEFVHDIAFNLQKGVQNDVVVMDFAKAIDKVAHSRLLYKLSSYGVKGNTMGWISSFLIGSSQRVVLEGKLSSSGLYILASLRAQFLAQFCFSFISMTFRSTSPTAL